MRECKICHCDRREIIRKHEKLKAHKKVLEKTIIIKYVEKDTNVDRLKDILNKRVRENVENFTNFTIVFCWKVNNTEDSITVVKQEKPGSGSNQESLESIIKRVFIRINIDNFEEFT